MPRFVVLVDDNAHYMDESERYELAQFDDETEAVDACRRLVDSGLKEFYRPGMSAEELYSLYVSFGEDPFVVARDGAERTIQYSSWEYARTQSGIVASRRKSE